MASPRCAVPRILEPCSAKLGKMPSNGCPHLLSFLPYNDSVRSTRRESLPASEQSSPRVQLHPIRSDAYLHTRSAFGLNNRVNIPTAAWSSYSAPGAGDLSNSHPEQHQRIRDHRGVRNARGNTSNGHQSRIQGWLHSETNLQRHDDLR